MHDLVVAHVASDTTVEDLRLFMRLLHRSGVTFRSDVVLLFNSPSSVTRLTHMIEEENVSFLKLVDVHRNSNSANKNDSVLGFNLTRFMKKQSKKAVSEPIWGKKKHRVNDSALNETTESTELTHGSVVGFDGAELNVSVKSTCDRKSSSPLRKSRYMPPNFLAISGRFLPNSSTATTPTINSS